MKEYRSRNSGRYVFNEDMHNLQELALSPVELFRDCGLDFVISGCAITISQSEGLYTVNVTSGYVYLDGKIRKVPAFSGTAASINSIGIYATQPTAPQITYFNGDTDFMYNDYAAEIRVNFDNSDNIECVMAQQKGTNLYAFPNLRTTFFNHYCIMNNGTIGHVDSLVAGEIDVTTLKINSSNIMSLFVQKSGDTMSNNATLTFVKGSDKTVITGESISVDGTITAENLTLSGVSIITGSVTAASFVKTGGTSSQFLKADGSVDDTAYATNDRANTINARFDNYLLLTGGTLTGELTVNSTCLISGLLTLQAGLVGVNADLTGYVKAQKLEAIGEIKAASGGITGALTAGSAQINGALSAGSGQFTSTVTIGTTLTVSGGATAEKFIKTGGTSSQFLKANGDVDANVYALASSLSGYLPLTGGTLTGNLTINNANVIAVKFIKTGGTADQFLKANGDVDSRAYLPLTGGTVSGNITALKFIVTNGQSNQFLKADGSLDSNTYLTTSSAASTYLTKNDAGNTYLPLTGGILTGALTINATLTTLSTVILGGNTTVNGVVTATQFRVPDKTGFLKANGNIDTNTYLTTADAANTYLTKTDAASTYLTTSGAASNYLTKTDATNTYLSKSDAATTYLTKTDATSTYLTTNNASSTYLTKTDAANTYLKQSDASNTYLTKTDAANNYVKSSTLNSTLSNYVLQQQLNNYMPIEGGTMSAIESSISYYTRINARGVTFYNSSAIFTGDISSIKISNVALTASDRQLNLVGSLYATGTVTASNISSSSDERLKNKVSDIVLSAEQISNAPAILFTWKNNDEDKNKHIGTIAQYWQKILPESILNTQNGLMMEYGPAAMVSVINLAKEVVALKQEIAELKGQTN